MKLPVNHLFNPDKEKGPFHGTEPAHREAGNVPITAWEPLQLLPLSYSKQQNNLSWGSELRIHTLQSP